jgi:hypothetical protein
VNEPLRRRIWVGLFATYGWLAVVAILLLIIGYLPLAAYGCLLDEQEAAAALQEAQERAEGAHSRLCRTL